jgi:hypothetical protein
MPFVITTPDLVTAAATDLANIGSTISAANAAVVVPTTGMLAPAADGVSAAVGALFEAHGEAYQAFSSQLAGFHNEFVQALTGGANAYASAEAANASPLQTMAQAALNTANATTDAPLGHPIFGSGTNGFPGTGETGGLGGILYGNGGTGGSGGVGGIPFGNGGRGGAGAFGGAAGLLGSAGSGGTGGPGGFFGQPGGNGGAGGRLWGNGGTGESCADSTAISGGNAGLFGRVGAGGVSGKAVAPGTIGGAGGTDGLGGMIGSGGNSGNGGDATLSLNTNGGNGGIGGTSRLPGTGGNADPTTGGGGSGGNGGILRNGGKGGSGFGIGSGGTGGAGGVLIGRTGTYGL